VSSCTKQQSQVHGDIEINLKSDNADEDADANKVVDGENAEKGESLDKVIDQPVRDRRPPRWLADLYVDE